MGMFALVTAFPPQKHGIALLNSASDHIRDSLGVLQDVAVNSDGDSGHSNGPNHKKATISADSSRSI
jgi:hypothetical protein